MNDKESSELFFINITGYRVDGDRMAVEGSRVPKNIDAVCYFHFE